MAARLSNTLVSLGLEPDDRVAVQFKKSPRALALYAACAQSGLVFLPLNTADTTAELAYFLENSGAALVVCDPSKQPGLEPIAQTQDARIETLAADVSGSLMRRAIGMLPAFEPVARDIDDLAAILYTSGTTGRSKGAMLTHGNLLSNAETLVAEWQFSEQVVVLHALPIFHTHGLFVASNAVLASGGSMIFLQKFDLDHVLRLMPQATTMMGVPTFYTHLLGDERFQARCGHHILERYGMTETNMNTSNPYDGERRAGTVGFPLPDVELKVTDPENGEALPQGEIGMIEVRGPNVFRGYLEMPEIAAELREDGFFVTGDLGRVDADGYVHIVGRGKDLIISGGYNIYPEEIELLLDDQPGVLESAVIGVPNPDFGETPVGILVPVAGQPPDLEAIQSSIKQDLARFKHPQKLILLDELTRNTMGKVQKNVLRERYEDLFTKAEP